MNTRKFALASSLATLLLSSAALADDPGASAQASLDYSVQAHAGLSGPAETQAGSSADGRVAIDEGIEVPVTAVAAAVQSELVGELNDAANQALATEVHSELAGELNAEIAGEVRDAIRAELRQEIRGATSTAADLLR